MAKINLIPEDRQPKPSDSGKQAKSGKRLKQNYARRRASMRLKHATMDLWRRLTTFVGFLILAGLAYGAYHIATNWDKVSLDYFIPIGSYTLLRKEIIPGYVIAKDLKEGQQRKDWSDWVDPRFLFTCQSGTTKQTIYFEVPESEYRSYALGVEIDKGDTALWEAMSKESYKAAFEKPVIEPEPTEDDDKSIKIELPSIAVGN